MVGKTGTGKKRTEGAMGGMTRNETFREKGQANHAVGVHHLPRLLASEADGDDVKLGVSVDADELRQGLEMLERIRLAAGQTS